MSGIGFWEFFFLCMIGLVVLGPRRLPQVANQVGTWVGQARRMTRVLKRQLEDELDLGKDFDVRPGVAPASHPPPRDDDSYSPLHRQPSGTAAVTPAAPAGDDRPPTSGNDAAPDDDASPEIADSDDERHA